MAAFDYGKIIAKARDVVARFGGPATLVYEERGAYNPVTDTQEAPAVREVATRAVVAPGGIRTAGGQYNALPVTVKIAAADLPVGLIPQQGWRVVVGERVYVVSSVTPIMPNGTDAILYTLGTAE